jgi:hypothetical protein
MALLLAASAAAGLKTLKATVITAIATPNVLFTKSILMVISPSGFRFRVSGVRSSESSLKPED